MPRLEVPRVRPGDPITAALVEKMRLAVLQCRLVRGHHTRVTELSDGTIVNFEPVPADFAHPWQCALRGQTGATIRPGTINGIEAAIDGVPLSDSPPPALTWKLPQLDADGRGYLCAEVTLDADAELAVKTVEIVQVADPDDGAPGHTGAAAALPGLRARHPLAMLRRRADGRLALFQITHFDLLHRAALKEDGHTPARNFFY